MNTTVKTPKSAMLITVLAIMLIIALLANEIRLAFVIMFSVCAVIYATMYEREEEILNHTWKTSELRDEVYDKKLEKAVLQCEHHIHDAESRHIQETLDLLGRFNELLDILKTGTSKDILDVMVRVQRAEEDIKALKDKRLLDYNELSVQIQQILNGQE